MRGGRYIKQLKVQGTLCQLLHCMSTITIIISFLTIHLYFVYCLSSLQKRYRSMATIPDTVAKTVLSIATIPDTDVGSNDCCMLVDHTEAGEPSKAG